MAKFYIPKRIELFPLIKLDDWQDTYIIVRSCNAQDIKEFQQSVYKTQKELKTLKKQANVTDEAITEKEMETFDVILEFVKDRFIRGVVYDSEENKKVELTREDLSQFNLEILQLILAEMFGRGSDLKKN
jgi:CRISPR/Cas system-associated protein Csx1